MSVLEALASAQGVRTQEPNLELARRLAEYPSPAALAVLAAALESESRHAGDVLTVFRELAVSSPEQVVQFVPLLAARLSSRNNRLVWGAMEALHALSTADAQRVATHAEAVMGAITTGSVITADHGAGVLGNIAEQRPDVVPFLLEHLNTCGAKYVPLRMARALAAVTPSNGDRFLAVLDARERELSRSGVARLRKVRRQVAAAVGVRHTEPHGSGRQ